MSEKIDWSNAPDSAMVLLKHVRDGAYAVAESYGDEAKTWHWPDPRYSFPLMPAMWRVVAERPSTPSWSGEGLPPVGVVCEGRIRNSGNANDWFECEVLAHHKNLSHCAGVLSSDENELLWCSEFRRVRTPEQIEADEREAAIGRMCKISAAPHMLRRHAEALYDAGYRKP